MMRAIKVRFGDDLIARVKDAAEKDHRNQSEFIRLAVEARLQDTAPRLARSTRLKKKPRRKHKR